MRAMILAAGRGDRMGNLTADVPKPLLRVHGHYLVEYPLYALASAGIQDVVMNVSYHAEKIEKALGNGARYGLNILYSREAERLETGGGIFQALPLLGNEPFIGLSCDIITDFPFAQFPKKLEGLAHLILVKNPSYHPAGDFGLVQNKVVIGKPTFTFSSMGIYSPELFKNCEPGKFRLGTLLKEAIAIEKVSGELYHGAWYNVGTPADLKEVNGLIDIPLKSLFSTV